MLYALSQGFSKGWHLRYPPFHLYVLTIAYSPVLIILFFLDLLQVIDLNQFPILYQQNSIDRFLFAGYSFLFYLGRLVTVLMGTSTVYAIYKCGREMYDEKSSLFAALLVTLSWPICFYSKTINLDIPYLFWFCFSLLYYLRILKFHRIVDYCFFAIAAVFSICTKDQAYALYILPTLMIIISFYKFKKNQQPNFSISQFVVEKNITIPLGTSIVLFCLIHNVIFNWTGVVKHFQLITGSASQNYQLFEASWSGYLKLYRLVIIDVISSLQLPVFCVCLGGIIFSFLKNLVSSYFGIYYFLVCRIIFFLLALFYITMSGLHYLSATLCLFWGENAFSIVGFEPI